MDSQTRQRLLELVYDLLPEAEAAELHRQIDADEQLAQAYAEARDTARLLAEAAKLPLPKVQLKPPDETVSTASDASPPQTAIRAEGPVRMRRTQWAGWAVLSAAVLLLLVPSVGSYWWYKEELDRIAGGHLRVMVTGPATLSAGVAARYAVRTTAITGVPVPAEIELALYSPDGKQLHDHKEKADRDGRLEVAIPASVRVPPGAELKVTAVHGDQEEPMETRLAVEPVRHVTHLALDKPLYQPGETVYYRSLTLSRFGLAADAEMAIHFEILDPSGAVVPGSPLEGVTQHGVGSGAFTIPEQSPGGEYVLVARSLGQAFPEERRRFFVRSYRLPQLKKELEFTRDSYAPGETVVADLLAKRRDGAAAAGAKLHVIATVDGQQVFQKDAQSDQSGAFQVKFDLPGKIQRGDGQLAVVVDDGGNRETIAKTIPINLGKVEVTFYPEGGDLVDKLENRVYFVGRHPGGTRLAEPVHIEGTIVDGSGKKVAAVKTVHEGMGSFSFTPQAGRQYRLKITSPAEVSNEPKLPEVSTRQKVVLSTGIGVFAAGAPVEFNVRAGKAGMPLVVGAFCRGVPVGQQALVTTVDADKGTGANPVAIAVPDEVGGVIRLTVYDYSNNPPQPVAERLVYRRMGRGLNVRPEGLSEGYSPGEHVKMSLMVTNEKGAPVPAVLGVAVVDDALLSLADDDTPAMNTHFLLTTEVQKPEDLEDADFYLSGGTEAEVALDLLLGTQGWRRFAEKSLGELRTDQPSVGAHLRSVPGRPGESDEQLLRLAAIGGPSNPPAVFDNLKQIESGYRESLAAYQAEWDRGMDVLLTLSFLGGLGLVLLMALLGLLKVVSGVHFWVPAVGVAACGLAVGVVLIDPARLRSGPQTAVAFAPFHVEPPRVTKAKEDSSSGADPTGLVGPVQVERLSELDVLVINGQAGEHGWGYGLGLDGFPMQPGAFIPMQQPHAALLGKLAEMDDYAYGLRYRRHFAGRDELEKLGAGGRDPAVLGDLKRLAELGYDLNGDGYFDVARAAGMGQIGGELAQRLERYRFTVRQYAHQHVPDPQVGAPPGVRTDFTETVFWHPLLLADADGRAEVAFDLSDSTGIFRLRVDAHGEGRIGSGTAEVISRIPFSLEPKLPLEVSAGDSVDLPLAVVNDSKDELPVELRLEHGNLVTLEGKPDRQLKLRAAQRAREHYVLQVTGEKGDCELTFRGTAGSLADAVKRPLRIVPPGFPKELSYSGQIDGAKEVVVELPEYWVPGSLQVTLSAFPSMLANLQKGMDSILQEPNGCFEQASTSNYPNVLTLQLMQQQGVADPAVTRRAKDLLKSGYAKLVGYECRTKGYEWFGGDPGHEALTAYGLMQFRDMARVYDVDRQMLDRTARWLLDRRDGRGGFQRNAKALDSFGGAPQDVTDAYITWALSESGQKGIEAEIKHAVQLAAASNDPYLIALAAAGALGADQKDDGQRLLDKLAKAQADDGHLEGKQGSITRSGGQSLKVETTALAALAWLKSPAFTDRANRAVQWIVENRQGSGGFGSTQATILALKALVEHSKANRRTLAAGTLIVKRDDLEIGQHAFEASRQETIVIDGLEANLRPGPNRLTVNLTGENKMPYALDVRFRTRKPSSHENCPVRLKTELAKGTVKAGETVAMTAQLSNATAEGQPMTIAVLGLPAGLEARPDQLEELKKAGTIDYYETAAREVICYWRSLAPKKEVTVKLDLVAAVPGRYTGPASRTYLYYTSEQKQWADPLQVEITRE